jgi:hypothetical protein
MPEVEGMRKTIIDFKNCEEYAVRHLVIESLEKLQYLDIPGYLLVVRAFGNKELTHGDMGTGSLDRLGVSISGVFDWEYDPAVIYKKRTVPIKSLSILQRQAVMEGIYGFKPEGFENLRRVLIIDDVVTTGTTVRAIAEPILKVFPKAEIIAFAIAWTPTARQQEYIQESEAKRQMLNEPETEYESAAKWLDTDFEFGQTHISVF